MKAHHAIAGSEFFDAWSGGDDGSGEFVAENLRRLDITLEDFFYVGAADAACGDFDEDFVGANFGDGDIFDANDAFIAIHACAHDSGDRPESAERFNGCAGVAHCATTCFTLG